MESPSHRDKSKVAKALQTQESVLQIAQSITALQLAGRKQAARYQKQLETLAGGPATVGALSCSESPLNHCLHPGTIPRLGPCLYCQKVFSHDDALPPSDGDRPSSSGLYSD